MTQNTGPDIRQEINQVLSEWRKSTLNIIYPVIILVGAVGLIVVLVTDTIPHPEQLPQLLFYAGLYIVTIFFGLKPAINYRIRAWWILLLLYILALLALGRGGLAGDGRLFLFSLPVLATILVNLTAAAGMVALNIVTMLVFSQLAATNVLERWILMSLVTDPLNPQYWVTETVYTVLIIGIVIALLNRFYHFLVLTLETERHTHRQILQTQEMLEQANQNLEAEVDRRTAELAAAVKEAEEARLAAENASRAKSAFLATMSHEIRTPLNAITGMTSLLLDTPLTLKQTEFTQVVHSSGETLLALINDILDFSKIEADRLDLEEQPFLLRQALESAIDQLNPRAIEKGIELAQLSIENTVPAAIVGDQTRLRQVLANLLSNAVKFTEKGEVEISVRAEPLEPQPGSKKQPEEVYLDQGRYRVEFAIRDTGIGIAPESLSNLFQPFNQVDASATRQYGGTGLGLAISKRLVEMMGGEIWVKSEYGKGSTFFFTIEAQAAPSPPPKTRSDARIDLHDKRILIVDDNATNRRILTMQIQAWNLHARQTASATEAIVWVRQGEPFDAAIIDIDLSDMDGVSLAREITRIRPDLPMIMLASLGSKFPPGSETLFSSVLTKPAKASHLYNALIALFAGEVEAALRDTASTFPLFDPHMAERLPLRILIVEDNTINQNLAVLMLERLGYHADTAANGLEALEALRRQPYDVVLMDVQMPKMDGFEATQQIRKNFDPHLQPRIIAMTANAMAGDREECLAVGMDDYVSKPIHVEDLINSLNRCQPGAIRDQSLYAREPLAIKPDNEPVETPSCGEDGDVLEIVELIRLRDTLGTRAEVMLPTLVTSFFRQASKLLAEARLALDNENLDDVRRAAHTLKANSAGFGAKSLTSAARRLEEEARSGRSEHLEDLLFDAEIEFQHTIVALRAAAETVAKSDGDPRKLP